MRDVTTAPGFRTVDLLTGARVDHGAHDLGSRSLEVAPRFGIQLVVADEGPQPVEGRAPAAQAARLAPAAPASPTAQTAGLAPAAPVAP